MSKYRCNGNPIQLVKEINRSGEGIIYTTDRSGVLAKVYHQITPEQIEKLKVMIKYPPTDPTLPKGHVSIAWPKDLLEKKSGKVVGFVMSAISDGQTLTNVYSPTLRKIKAPGFNWFYLHTTAMNIAYILQEVHAKKYVVGDLKPDNLLVTSKANVSIIDTDSFQIVEPRLRKIYHCNVTTPEYTPPELFGHSTLQGLDRSEFQDRFGLAIIIWHLLFGDHPFSGQWQGQGNPPSLNDKIENGSWRYGSNSKIRPGPHSIPLNILHPDLQKLFRQCFNDGHKDPHKRPSAAEWRQALKVAIQNLRQCSVEPGHHYAKSYRKCYWCERKRQLGVDRFPTPASAKKTPTRSPVTSPIPSPPRGIVPNPFFRPTPSPLPTPSPRPIFPLPTFPPSPPPPPPSKFARLIQSIKLALPTRLTRVEMVVLGIILLLLGYGIWTSRFFHTIVFQEVVLNENFTSPSKWALTSGAKFKDGGLFHRQTQVNTAGASRWIARTFTDVDFSADAVKVDGPNDVPFGLIARGKFVQNNWNGYFLRITADGRLSMGVLLNGKSINKIENKRSNAIDRGNNQTNRLRIVCRGSLIMGFINGKLVGSFRDNSHSFGEIAVESTRYTRNAVAVYFDNVLVKEPSFKLSQFFNHYPKVKLSPKETIEKYYQLATSDRQAAIELLSDEWRQAEKKKVE